LKTQLICQETVTLGGGKKVKWSGVRAHGSEFVSRGSNIFNATKGKTSSRHLIKMKHKQQQFVLTAFRY
jgi:hypothetical protein